MPEELPFTADAELDQPLRSYWQTRLRQHVTDSYMGVSLSKFPEDLRVYEHLLWLSRANTVIEVGAQSGGSALWFRDRLASQARYTGAGRATVISIDLDIAEARQRVAAADRVAESSGEIVFLQGDVRDPDLAERAARVLPEGARCLVSEDSAHVYDTTYAALESLSRFVPPGGFFVVEDGVVDVDVLRVNQDWPQGVLPAVRDWLANGQGAQFTTRRDLELYGVTCHPRGFLQRRTQPPGSP
jgi:cephalosporin hydroxylase